MTNRAPDFKKDLVIGDEAMQIVIQKLMALPGSISVIDVSQDLRYQDLDVDLLWVREHENREIVTRVEVKGDTYPERNFFLEAWSNLERGTPGCLVKSQSDYIYYYFMQTGNGYLLETSDLRTFMFAHPDYHNPEKHKKITNTVRKGITFTSMGIATNIAQTLKQVRHYTIQ